MWICVHEGFPIITLPGANIFYTNEDVSTPLREDGTRLISCHQNTATRALVNVAKVSRWLLRAAEAAAE